MQQHGRKLFGYMLFLCSLGTYIYSLSLPALLFDHHHALIGFEVMKWGWWGILVLEFGWFANLAFIFAIAGFIANDKPFSIKSSIVTILLGLTSFHAKEWFFNESSGTPITGLGVGFYIWMLSFLIILVTCITLQTPNPTVKRDAP